MSKQILGLLVALITVLPVASAQEQWGEGEVEDAVVVIEKERKITLPFASRRFEKVPPLPSATKDYNLSYTLRPIPFSSQPIQPRMRVLTIKQENLSRINGNFVKAGFGNYLTPYLDANIGNGRNAESSYGVKATHLSSGRGPVDGNNSASSYTFLKGYLNGFTDIFKYGGDIHYRRDGLFFYGYRPGTEVDRDTIKQTLNHFGISAFAGSADADEDFQYLLNLSYDNIGDAYSAQESDFDIDLKTSLILDDPLLFGLDAGLSFTTRSDVLFDKQSRNIYRATGYLEYKLTDELAVMGGARVAYETDTAGTFHIYPIAKATYALSDQLLVYAGIDGDLEQRGYRSFARQNEFLGPNVDLAHQDKRFEFNAGLQGAGFEVGFKTARYNDMGFFVNDPSDTTRFQILYDKVTRLHLFGDLTVSSSGRHNLSVRADYWGYSTDTLAQAWHAPNYRLGLNGSTNFFGKFYVDIDAYVMGGITARNPTDFAPVELDAIVDLNAKLEYKVSDQFGAFVSANNLIGNNYQRFLNYQTRGIQFMAGFSYVF